MPVSNSSLETLSSPVKRAGKCLCRYTTFPSLHSTPAFWLISVIPLGNIWQVQLRHGSSLALAATIRGTAFSAQANFHFLSKHPG